MLGLQTAVRQTADACRPAPRTGPHQTFSSPKNTHRQSVSTVVHDRCSMSSCASRDARSTKWNRRGTAGEDVKQNKKNKKIQHGQFLMMAITLFAPLACQPNMNWWE